MDRAKPRRHFILTLVLSTVIASGAVAWCGQHIQTSSAPAAHHMIAGGGNPIPPPVG